MPKASAQEFHQTQNTSATGKPSRRTGPVSPDRFESPQEGLRRLLPEPTPSPRLWAASPGATPARLCEHTTGGFQPTPKIGTFYFGGIRNFLLWSDTESLLVCRAKVRSS